MLEPIGWLDGLTALSVVIAGTFFGLLSFYKSIKLKAKLLGMTGLCLICIGYTLLGPAVDFLNILITDNNLTPFWLYGLLSYPWAAPLTIFALYIGGELMIPKKKWYLVSSYTILSIIFEAILFYYTFTNPYYIYVYPDPLPTGTELLNSSLKLASLPFILMLIFLLTGFIFNGFGFLRKSFQSSGELKRKFLYLSLGWFFFIICGALDGLLDTGIITFFVRIGTIISIVFMYIGIRSK